MNLKPQKAVTQRHADGSQLLSGLDNVSKNSNLLEPVDNFSMEEFKAKVLLQPPQRASDEDDIVADEAVIAECDVSDDEDEVQTKFNGAQRHILTNKTPLETNSNYLNNVDFREAYLKEKVTGKQIVERKQEKA